MIHLLKMFARMRLADINPCFTRYKLVVGETSGDQRFKIKTFVPSGDER